MTCEELLALFSQYLDGELPADRCDDLEQHASSCGQCAEFLAGVKRVVNLCRDLKAGQSPGPLPSDVQTRLRDLYERRAGRG